MRRLLYLCIVTVCCGVGFATRFEAVRHLRTRHADDGEHGTHGSVHGSLARRHTARPLFSWDLTLEKNATDDTSLHVPRSEAKENIQQAKSSSPKGTALANDNARNKRRRGDAHRWGEEGAEAGEKENPKRRHPLKKNKRNRLKAQHQTPSLNTTTPRERPETKPKDRNKNKNQKNKGDKTKRKGKKNRKNRKNKKKIHNKIDLIGENKESNSTILKVESPLFTGAALQVPAAPSGQEGALNLTTVSVETPRVNQTAQENILDKLENMRNNKRRQKADRMSVSIDRIRGNRQNSTSNRTDSESDTPSNKTVSDTVVEVNITKAELENTEHDPQDGNGELPSNYHVNREDYSHHSVDVVADEYTNLLPDTYEQPRSNHHYDRVPRPLDHDIHEKPLSNHYSNRVHSPPDPGTRDRPTNHLSNRVHSPLDPGTRERQSGHQYDRVPKPPVDLDLENSIDNKISVNPSERVVPVNDTEDNQVPVFSPVPDRDRDRVKLCADNVKAGCEHICLEVKGQSVCACYRGFQQKGTKCRDIDECAVSNGGCERGCLNTMGSYHCFCPRGLRLSDNDKTCIDVNECLLRNGHGPCQDTCTNTWAGYTCTCSGLPGTRLASNNHTCDDLDECSKNNAGCSHTCLNTLGNAFCLCPPGYMLGDDWKTCHDIDECATEEYQNELCPGRCVNTVGSYHCGALPECPPGFEHGPTGCEDVDECEDREMCSQLCVNTNGSFHCACKVGYMLAKDKRTCKEVQLDAICPPLDTPRHGYVVCTRLSLKTGPWRHRIVNHSGSICELRCPVGYRITGLYRRFCGQSGRWLGPSYGSCDRIHTPN